MGASTGLLTIIKIFSCIAVMIGVLLAAPLAAASTYIPLDPLLDEGAYEILDRLEAQGFIESGLLSVKPISRKEAARLVLESERKAGEANPQVLQMISSLKERFKDEIQEKHFVKPLDIPYGRIIYSSSEERPLAYNLEGDTFEKGINGRLGFTTRMEQKWLSVSLTPELRVGEGDTDLLLRSGYGVISFLGMDLTAGKQSQWWGPGHHGALLLSNNIEPLTMVKLSNPSPVLLPWIFKYLGPFGFTLFFSRLEDDRIDVAQPYFWGLRVDFKPLPIIEIGLERTAFFGGEGRCNSSKCFLDSLLGKGENDPGSGGGDQKAGFDVKLTIPNQWQPFQLYMEAAGEDEAGGLPSKWAYLAGIYLPRVMKFDGLSFRAEYARTDKVWYSHIVFTAGYTYKGMIIGHHMGRDAEDFFVEVSYLLPNPDRMMKVNLAYDREEHNNWGKDNRSNVKEKKNEASLSFDMYVTKNLKAQVLYRYGRFENFGGFPGKPGKDKSVNLLMGGISYNL